ncbi:MAG: alpha/beta hydrolase [Aquabacterium sp.]|nr:MAG: alpha/beta hydrolase [Aquabacterium sp.]
MRLRAEGRPAEASQFADLPAQLSDEVPQVRGLIVFSHANSFPASTYRLHFRAWQAAGYDVIAVEKFGHDPRYPVNDSWTNLERQLVDFLDEKLAEHPGVPVYMVGHSFGGYVSLMAALSRPERVGGVVLLDSPVLSGWKAKAVRLAKTLRVVNQVTPARVSATRRNHWADTQAAWEHFSDKPMFKRWAPEVLADYMAAGIEPLHAGSIPGSGRTLTFRREVETLIYGTLPEGLLERVRRQRPPFPVAFIGGRRSRELRQVGLAGTRRLVGERFSWINGSHLYPFEHPQQTAQEVLRWLRNFEASPASA